MAGEDPVEDERREKDRCGHPDRHVRDGIAGGVAAKVRKVAAVVEHGGRDRPIAIVEADMQHHGHVVADHGLPERIEVRV